MFDLKAIRENPAAFDAGLARRGLEGQSSEILALDEKRRELMTVAQEKQARRNEASREIGKIKSQGGDADAIMKEVAGLKNELADLEVEEKRLGEEINDILCRIPNIPHSEVPEGKDESDNVEVRTHGDIPSFDFEPKRHFDIGEGLGLMDFETAAEISGSRFVILKDKLARLSRALGQFMLDLHTDTHGYREMQTPCLVKSDALFGTGQLPKFEDDLFKTTADHWLIPTAEVTLTNLGRGQIIPTEDLPLRYTALTQCFRAEAGAAGRDTRGMIRQHQFDKVELVTVTTEDKALAELDYMTNAAEEVLKRLGLSYRVVMLCTGDMGFSAQKTFDIEVWLPGENQYREISSCSVCGDFQARRMNMRHRPKGEKKTEFATTLNGSGVAVGRALVAVLENYQQADGSVIIPEALRPYMNGLEVLTK